MFFNFNKPGRGVPKKTKELNGFFQYFSSISHNLTKIFFLNILNLVVLIPYALFMSGIKEELGISPGMSYIFDILCMMIFSLVGIIPIAVGTSYVSSLFAKDEPCFLTSDFFGAIKDNYKNTLLMFIIELIVFYLFMVGYKFYFVSNLGNGMLKITFMIILFLYLTAHIYINYLTVTYKLKVFEIYKKAMLFTLLNLPQNILIMLLISVIYGICFFITTLLGYFVSGALAYSFVMLLINLYAQRTIRKYERR